MISPFRCWKEKKKKSVFLCVFFSLNEAKKNSLGKKKRKVYKMSISLSLLSHLDHNKKCAFMKEKVLYKMNLSLSLLLVNFFENKKKQKKNTLSVIFHHPPFTPTPKPIPFGTT